MPSREVTDRKKSADAVVAAIDTHAEGAGQALAAQFKGVLRKGETAPDMTLALRLFGRMLARDSAAAVAADDRHEDEKSDDAAPRNARDAAAVLVRDACVHARDGVSTVHEGSNAVLKSVAMADPPPSVNDHAALGRWATSAAAKLADAKVTLPAPTKRGVSIDRKALAEGITEHLGALTTAVGAVETERRELEATQLAKNGAVERNDKTFAAAAGFASVVLRAAGMSELADRVRPSSRQPGRTVSTDPGAAPTGGGTGTG